MRILMLGWELPPHNAGGMGVACYHLSKALAVQGASIDFVVPYAARHDDISFMEIHHATQLDPLHRMGLGAYTAALDTSEPTSSDSHQPASLRAIQRQYTSFVAKKIKALDPDVIHAHDWLTFEAGIAAKRATNKPLIAHVHATEFDRAGASSGNPLIHDIEYMGLMMADRIFAVSNITKNIIVERYGIPADKVEIVHNSIDPSVIEEAASQSGGGHYPYAQALQQEGTIVVTAIGRLTVQKGLTHFLKAAAMASRKVDNLLFLMVGDGEQRDELIELSAELGIADKVLFTGYVRGSRWREAYALSDVFVMSSVSEPFGLTALEAAAYDTAVIATNQSGVVEVMSSLLTYDHWDHKRLADMIVNLALSASLRKELSANAKHEFQHMSWHSAAEKCLTHYRTSFQGALA